MSEKNSGKCAKHHNKYLVQGKLHAILFLNNSACVGKIRDL